MIAKIQRATRNLAERVKTQMKMRPSVRRYIAYCRRTWPLDYPRSKDSVVMVGIFTWNASVHCYAHFTNHIARKTGSTIEWYDFHRKRNYLYEAIFTAFGARRGLSLDDLQVDESAARKLADGIVAGLKTKWDVINIAIEGVEIGDLIYDTYLRSHTRATVDVADPGLVEIIYQAVLFSMAVKSYFSRKKVVAAIVDHVVYLQSGIICRLACCSGIPVYQVHYGPDFYVLRVENDREISDVPSRLPWPRFRELFKQLSPEEQTRGLERGRRALEDRLSGKVDGVLFSLTAYANESSVPVLQPGNKPRVLVLLHEFCDTVHCYRRMLFPDFLEWANYILRIAEETDFDWYVKPHPSILIFDEIGRKEQGILGRKIVADLQEKYPHVHFLDPRVSNRQIIAEGITAMFNVHGTAAHEFAYLGVPVVNAGDNPHTAYHFNIHPQTLAEYEHCIRHADRLAVDIRREEIEEYFFMNYFYFAEHYRAEANPIPPSYFESEYYRQNYNGNHPEVFDHMTGPQSATETEILERYFDRVLAFRETSAAAVALTGANC